MRTALDVLCTELELKLWMVRRLRHEAEVLAAALRVLNGRTP